MKNSIIFCLLLLLISSGFAFEEMTFNDAAISIHGYTADNRFGRIVASGDLNGDGYEDLICGTYDADDWGINSNGKVCVFLGEKFQNRKTEGLNNNIADLIVLGGEEYAQLGEGICTGDIDGDGIDDLIIGASGKSFTNLSYAGAVYVLKGGESLFINKIVNMSEPPTTLQYYTIKGAAAGQALGSNVTTGDFNNDGKDDLLIGALPYFGDGEVYSVISKTTFPLFQTIDLATTSNYSRRILAAEGLDSLSAALISGDLNHDGYDDMIMSATMAGNMLSKDSTGRVYIFWGAQTPPIGLSLNLKTTAANLTIKGRFNSPLSSSLDFDSLGESLAMLDFNNDGYLDLAIGAPDDEIVSLTTQNIEPGFTYIIFGETTFPSLIDLTVAGNGFTDKAFSIIGATLNNIGCGAGVIGGKFDTDAIDDIGILSVNAGRESFTSESKTYIISGNISRAKGQYLYITDNPFSAIIYGNKTYMSSVMSITKCNFSGEQQDEVFIGAPFYDTTDVSDCGGVFGLYPFQTLTATSNLFNLYE